jgi:hypothetical protein
MEVSGQLHTPAALPAISEVGRFAGFQSRSGGRGEEKKSHHCSCREFNPSSPSRDLISMLAELPRLLYVSARA